MQATNGSQVKYITALSAGASNVSASAETGASNFAGFEFATLILSLGSPPNLGTGGGLATCMLRSGTSNGTFSTFGASLTRASTGSRQTIVRSFSLDSSATWYKVGYDNSAGVWNGTILVALHNPRWDPVDSQDSHTTVLSDVLGG